MRYWALAKRNSNPMNNAFTVLFDYDSMIYKAAHKIVSTGEIRKWIAKGRSREWMEIEIRNEILNRLANMADGILLEIEDTGINVVGAEYFLTACPNSKRKAASQLYKAKRKKNKWVNLARDYFLEMGVFSTHDEWEADDLIKDRAIYYGEFNCVICTMDKDLKQIPGIHFDYYRAPAKEFDISGNRIVPPCRGIDVITKEEANRFFWKQMLMGDSGDGVVGIPQVGPKKAENILEGVTDLGGAVLDAYVEHFGEEEGKEQFELHKLLIGLGVEHRP